MFNKLSCIGYWINSGHYKLLSYVCVFENNKWQNLGGIFIGNKILSNLCIHCKKNQSNSLTYPSVKECTCNDPCWGLVFKAPKRGLQFPKEWSYCSPIQPLIAMSFNENKCSTRTLRAQWCHKYLGGIQQPAH